MPTLYWTGTADNNINNVNNYLDAPGGSTPGTGPVNGDELIFWWGANDVAPGASSLTGITMRVTQGYSGRIGPGGALGIALTLLEVVSGGEINLTGNITAGKVRCRSGAFNYSGGTADALYIESSDYTIGPSAVVTSLQAYNAHGSDSYNATAYTLLDIVGGEHTLRRTATVKTDRGARLTVAIKGKFAGSSVISGNSKVYYSSAESVASGQSVEVKPDSVFNAAASPGFTWPGVLKEWPGSDINLRTSGGLVKPTTRTEIGIGDAVSGTVPI